METGSLFLMVKNMNGEHYRDDTADKAIANIEADENLNRIITNLKRILNDNGFVLEDLTVIHLKTERYYWLEEDKLRVIYE